MAVAAHINLSEPTSNIKLPNDYGVNGVLPPDDPNYVDPTLLPTVGRTGLQVDPDVDAAFIAKEWLDCFAKSAEENDANAFANCFMPDGFIRDKLSLTWKYRTIRGTKGLVNLAQATLKYAKPSGFKIASPEPSINKPYEDLSFIQAHFVFNTVAGASSGVFNLVPHPNGSYKAWTVSTILESLHKYPVLGSINGHSDSTDTYEERRKGASEFKGSDPEVLVIGGGHCGIQMSAQLNSMGISNLVIERNARIGDNWRKRYSSLCLHLPHWADHFPFLNYPKNWPEYIPAEKVANWIEHYAEIFDLNVWTSSSVLDPKYDDKLKRWVVPVTREGSIYRILYPKQVVLSPGLAGRPYSPAPVKGQDKFRGVIFHSTKFRNAKPFKGKKVVVVGTSSSGFDVSYDCVKNDVDVTVIQRSPTFLMSLTHGPTTCLYPNYWYENAPPLEVADRIFHHMPIHVTEALGQRSFADLWEKDSELIQALAKKGLRTWRGEKSAGVVAQGWSRSGGFYFDSGACKHIISGRIKIEPGSIEGFTEDEVILSNGTKLDADVVIWATGFTPVKDAVEDIMGKDIAEKNGDVWNLDKEGELRNVWANTKVDKMKIVVGSFQWNRSHSKLVAMQIIAEERGLTWPKYED